MLKRNPRDPQYGDEIDTESEEALGNVYQRPASEGTAVPEARTESRPARAPRAESVIDAQSTFDGRFVAEGDLRIEGSISGELVCRGLLTVERDAQAKAKVEARDARILGHLDGEVTCSGKLELAPTAVVKGTIRAAVLVVEEGASLVGSVETKAPGSARPELRPVASNQSDESAAEAPAEQAATGTSSRERGSRPRSVPSFALSPSDPAANGRERN